MNYIYTYMSTINSPQLARNTFSTTKTDFTIIYTKSFKKSNYLCAEIIAITIL